MLKFYAFVVKIPAHRNKTETIIADCNQDRQLIKS